MKDIIFMVERAMDYHRRKVARNAFKKVQEYILELSEEEIKHNIKVNSDRITYTFVVPKKIVGLTIAISGFSEHTRGSFLKMPKDKEDMDYLFMQLYLPTVTIYGFLTRVPTELYDLFAQMEETFVHEYIHYLDYLGNRKPQKFATIDTPFEKYINSPMEINANFHSFVAPIFSLADKYKNVSDGYKKLKQLFPDVESIKKYIAKEDPSQKRKYDALTPENKKKFDKRLYQAWTDLWVYVKDVFGHKDIEMQKNEFKEGFIITDKMKIEKANLVDIKDAEEFAGKDTTILLTKKFPDKIRKTDKAVLSPDWSKYTPIYFINPSYKDNIKNIHDCFFTAEFKAEAFLYWVKSIDTEGNITYSE